MVKRERRRAALLAGLSIAMVSGGSAAHASSVRWGASAPAPADLTIRQPVNKPKQERAAKRKPAPAPRNMAPQYPPPREQAPRDIWRSETIGRSTTGSGMFAPFSAPALTGDAPSAKPDRKISKGKNRKEGTAVKAEPAGHALPAGPLHVIVSVTNQTASLYADGQFVASTKVSTGTSTHPTPLGVFTVLQKRRHHISNLYGAPMPYMQRLTWSGTALHTGALPGYPASHGCIRLTNDFAQLLWKATSIGARVIVTRNDVRPAEIAHTQLAMTVRPPEPETTGSTDAPVRTADATAATAVPSANLDIPAPAPIATGIGTDSAKERGKPAASAKPPAPVSIFISRKDGKLYVRQAMQPLFDMPLTLADAQRPLGTHVYTAMGAKDGTMRWTAVSIPSAFSRQTAKIVRTGKGKSKTVVAEQPQPAAASSATEALDRIELPREALDRLAGLVGPGSSLIVSDNGLSHETGKYTDFIVLTR